MKSNLNKTDMKTIGERVTMFDPKTNTMRNYEKLGNLLIPRACSEGECLEDSDRILNALDRAWNRATTRYLQSVLYIGEAGDS